MSNCLMDILGCTFSRISYKHFLCLVIIKETICIKCQSPFSWKIKKNLSKCCLALTLKAPITTTVSALSSACDFKSHFCKQCGPRSDSPLGTVWSGSTLFAGMQKIALRSLQEYSADDINRRHFQMQFFLALQGLNCEEKNKLEQISFLPLQTLVSLSLSLLSASRAEKRIYVTCFTQFGNIIAKFQIHLDLLSFNGIWQLCFL